VQKVKARLKYHITTYVCHRLTSSLQTFLPSKLSPKNGPETSGLKNDRWIPFLRDEEKAIVVLQGNEV
jgi:hypothetical protein